MSMKTNVSIEWCIGKLESLQKCNLNPESCNHDTDEHGKKQPFDYASIDMTLDAVISELKRAKAQSIQEDKDEISITWHIEDVFSLMFPDENGTRGHTDEEIAIAREVLELTKSEHDATIGVNWDTLQVWLDYVKEEKSS